VAPGLALFETWELQKRQLLSRCNAFTTALIKVTRILSSSSSIMLLILHAAQVVADPSAAPDDPRSQAPLTSVTAPE
jgi:hypothetical protein